MGEPSSDHCGSFIVGRASKRKIQAQYRSRGSGELLKSPKWRFQKSRKALLTLNCKHHPKLNDALPLSSNSAWWWHRARNYDAAGVSGDEGGPRGPGEIPALLPRLSHHSSRFTAFILLPCLSNRKFLESSDPSASGLLSNWDWSCVSQSLK